MLWECLATLRTPCPGYVRKSGLLRELVAIEARGRRCRKFWAPHLARSKELIARSAENAPGDGLAVVLGSGPLFDVPLEALTRRFETVVLADAAHAPGARRRAKKNGARLENVDVTGMLEEAMRAVRSDGGELTVKTPELYLDRDPDFVVSANLVSQLPLPFLRIFQNGANPSYHGEGFGEDFARRLIEAHFSWLSRFRGRVCLIADLVWITAREEAAPEEKDALRGARTPPGGERWLWEVAPRGEQSWDYARRNLVAGYVDFGAALAGKASAPG